MPRHYDISDAPLEYLTKPLEAWTFRELTDALGAETSAKALGVTLGAIRQMRHRGSTTPERTQVLHAALQADETFYRKMLVSAYTNREARRAAAEVVRQAAELRKQKQAARKAARTARERRRQEQPAGSQTSVAIPS